MAQIKRKGGKAVNLTPRRPDLKFIANRKDLGYGPLGVTGLSLVNNHSVQPETIAHF
jgi:hypothetical protein